MALQLGLAQNSHWEARAAEEKIHPCDDAWYGVLLQSAMCALANIMGVVPVMQGWVLTV